ncbi:MAG: hypothetical protein ACETVR_03710 [Candidatus Bathyarchaeia archaeon]
MSGDERPTLPIFNISMTLLLLLLFVGALSIISLYLGFEAFLSDHPNRAITYLMMGTGGFALIGYMFFRSKSVIKKVTAIPQIEVVTTLECQNCELKKIRPFQRGDYLFKEVEDCTRCEGKMVVEKIYGRERQPNKRARERLSA